MYKALILLVLMGCLTPQQVIKCPGTRMIGWTNQTEMTQIDILSYRSAKAGCARKYPQSPCLTVFEKVKDITYKATCGAKR